MNNDCRGLWTYFLQQTQSHPLQDGFFYFMMWPENKTPHNGGKDGKSGFNRGLRPHQIWALAREFGAAHCGGFTRGFARGGHHWQ